jgi:hypothetical protein
VRKACGRRNLRHINPLFACRHADPFALHASAIKTYLVGDYSLRNRRSCSFTDTLPMKTDARLVPLSLRGPKAVCSDQVANG